MQLFIAVKNLNYIQIADLFYKWLNEKGLD